MQSREKPLKLWIFCLSISVVISFLVIGVLLMSIFYTLSSKLTENPVSGSSDRKTVGKTYRIFLPESSVHGTVTSPDPIEEPISITDSENQQVMLIMGESELFAFEMLVDMYCCPSKELKEEEFQDNCELMADEMVFLAPAIDELDLRQKISHAVQFGGAVAEGFSFPDNVCIETEDQTNTVGRLNYKKVERMGRSYFICHGGCVQSNIQTFLSENSHENENERVLLDLHQKKKDMCSKYSISEKVFQSSTCIETRDVVDDFVGEILGPYCTSGDLLKVKDGKIGDITNICTAGERKCSYNPLKYE